MVLELFKLNVDCFNKCVHIRSIDIYTDISLEMFYDNFKLVFGFGLVFVKLSQD